MTIEEINALTKDDVIEILFQRLSIESDPLDGTLEVELADYKLELIEEENEELRKKDWKKRFDKVKDLRMTSHDAGFTKVSNLKIWVRDIINSKDDTILLALEAQSTITDQNMQDEKDKETQDKNNFNSAKQRLKNIDWPNVSSALDLKPIVKDILLVLRKLK